MTTNNSDSSGVAPSPQPPFEQPSVSYPYAGSHHPYAGYYPAPMPPPAPRRRAGRARVLGAGLAVLAAGAVLGGVAVAESSSIVTSGNGSTAQGGPTTPTTPGNNGTIPGDMNPNGGNPNGGNPNGGNGTSTSASLATAQQQKGIVTIVSVLGYQRAESAGTGMVLTGNGEILTNNHVVNGATSITVTVSTTGRSYRADVVGTDPSDDVAVLQLRNASGLTTAKLGDSAQVTGRRQGRRCRQRRWHRHAARLGRSRDGAEPVDHRYRRDRSGRRAADRADPDQRADHLR